MSAEADRAKLAETRRLIFTNLLRGARVDDVRAAFRASAAEVDAHWRFVANKIFEYRFRRAMPFVDCETPTKARAKRVAVMDTLGKLGPNYLTSDFVIRNPTVVNLEDRLATEKLQEIDARQQGR